MPRRVVVLGSLAAAMLCAFALGVLQARRADEAARARYREEINALRAELRGAIGHAQAGEPAATAGTAGYVGKAGQAAPAEAGSAGAGQTGQEGKAGHDALTPGSDSHAAIVAEVKEQLRSDLGLLPLDLLRDRRTSFVELYATDNFGKTNYGTAGYIGRGYFITGKHAVVALKEDDSVLELAFLNSHFQTGLRNILDRAVLQRQELHSELSVGDYSKFDELPFDFQIGRAHV